MRKERSVHNNKNAQAAIEYMLLFGAVVAIVLVGMHRYLPRANKAAEMYYNTVAGDIMTQHEDILCGNGTCDPFETRASCCVDCDFNGDDAYVCEMSIEKLEGL